MPTAVYIEGGTRRVFACSVEYPGWCRSAKTEPDALVVLAAYADRYAPVAERAGVRFPVEPEFEVIERLAGSGSTDFGAPDRVPDVDHVPLAGSQRQRLGDLMSASWSVFDDIVAGAAATLRKGPRGGGRDRDAVVDHLLESETAYGRNLGLKLRPPDRGDRGAIETNRAALIDAVVSGPPVDSRWPVAFAARRIAWHVLDHAWEIEDKSEPAGS